MSIRRWGPGRGSRQAVQVGGTFVVGRGINALEKLMEVVFSFSKSMSDDFWMIDV